MQITVNEMSKKIKQELEAAGAVISPAAFLEETIRFPEGTLKMAGSSIFGRALTYYLLPDHKTLAEFNHESMDLYPVHGDDLRIQQVLQANGRQ